MGAPTTQEFYATVQNKLHRVITKAKDVWLATEVFLEDMQKAEIEQYKVMTDF